MGKPLFVLRELMFVCDNMQMSLIWNYCQHGVEIILGKLNVTKNEKQNIVMKHFATSV